MRGLRTYVFPDFFRITERAPEGMDRISWRKGKNYLDQRDEVSNRIKIKGVLHSNPERFTTDRQKEICKYYLDSTRTVQRGGEEEEVLNSIYVRSLGKIALDNLVHLKRGSKIYIDGSIQETAGGYREVTCFECGEIFEVVDTSETMEIVPYSVEYLDGCNFEYESPDHLSYSISDEGDMDDAAYDEYFEDELGDEDDEP